MEKNNLNESNADTAVTVLGEQSKKNPTTASEKSDVEVQLDDLRDKINRQDQNIADNVMAIGDMLIQAKNCVKKIKKLKWQDWLAGNIKMPRITAYKYIKCTERFKNVSPAKHFDISKTNVAQMFELLSVPRDKFDQFLTDTGGNNITIHDMSKNELRDLIKNWNQNNTPPKPKKKFQIRLSIAEEDRTTFAELLKSILEEHTLSEDSLKSVASALKSVETTEPVEVIAPNTI